MTKACGIGETKKSQRSTRDDDREQMCQNMQKYFIGHGLPPPGMDGIQPLLLPAAICLDAVRCRHGGWCASYAYAQGAESFFAGANLHGFRSLACNTKNHILEDIEEHDRSWNAASRQQPKQWPVNTTHARARACASFQSPSARSELSLLITRQNPASHGHRRHGWHPTGQTAANTAAVQEPQDLLV